MKGYNKEAHFEIIEQLGILTTHSTGWSKELNIVSWNSGKPKYDIRDWDPSHEHMSRGATFTEEEMKKVIELVRQRNHPVRSMSKPKEKDHER